MELRIGGWLRGMAGRISFGPFRVTAYLLHATGLERIYKPRFMREHSALSEIDDAVLARLPKYCHTISGAKGDPINLILVGNEPTIKQSFKLAGWRRANPASPIHVAYGLLMAVLKKSYETGPFAPLYVNIAVQDLAYQQPTDSKNYRERHHLRIWRTGIILSDGRRVWVGAAGCENGMRLGRSIPFYTHSLDPNIDGEREYIVRTLEEFGSKRIKSVAMTKPALASRPARNAHSCDYFTDGRAVIVEL
jgi:hypothetical protein